MTVVPSDPDTSAPRPEGGTGRLVVDDGGCIVSLDPLVARWFGLSPDRASGVPLAELVEAAAYEWLEAALRRGGLGVQERVIRTRTGRDLRCFPDGERSFSVVDDSTHSAVNSERQDRSGDRARSAFAAAVARELNDPMSIVQGRLELLLELDSADPAMIRRHLSVALEHARRISSTLHQLRLVGGPLDSSVEVSAARRLITRAAAQVGGVQLELELRPPTLRLLGSPDLLEQVLVGLVRRVRDAARGEYIARVIGQESDGHTIVELRAELPGGMGVQPSAAPGDPRLDVGVSELVLSRIGGRLEALRLGRGVLFRLVLPQAPPLRRSTSRDAHVVVVGTTTPTDLCALLCDQGVDTTCVPDAEQALASLADQVPDGLVAALELPGVSGLTLVRAALGRWPELADRTVLVARTSPPGVPDGVRVCRLPVDHRALLRGLGLDPAG